MNALETMLQKIGAVKTEATEGKIIAYGVLGEYQSIERITHHRLDWEAVNRGGFFYLVRNGGGVIGILPNAKYEGSYPGNGSVVRFKASIGGWLARKAAVTGHEVYVPTDDDLARQIVGFYRAAIYPEFVEPHT